MRFVRVEFIVGLVLLFGSACSSGGLDDVHDRYMSIFGVPFAQPAANKGGIIGRAVLAGGSVAQFAQVHARARAEGQRHQPAVAMTNAKGGFHIGNLEPGDYRVFIISPSGEGRTIDLHVEANELVEHTRINLASMARVSGTVTLQNEVVHTGSVVYVPGSPFSSFTDHTGFYYLDVPPGQYRLRMERDTYRPHETDVLDVAGDLNVDTELEANPWPGGKIRIENSEDGFIVRGMSTTLKIDPVPGVRYMKFSRQGGLSNLDASIDVDTWIPVEQTVVFTTEIDGRGTYSIEFMDTYGKKSEFPQVVSFYNTSLDDSWRILYGGHDQPMTIRGDEKVHFLTDYGLAKLAKQSTAIVKSDGSKESEDASENIYGDDIGEVSYSATFYDTLRVEAGATLSGGAIFYGNLVVEGTAERPVIWDNRNSIFPASITQYGASVHFRNVKAKSVGLYLSNDYENQTVEIRNSVLEASYISNYSTFDGFVSPANRRIHIDHSRLERVYLNYSCGFYGADSSGGGGSSSGPESSGSANLILTYNILNQVQTGLNCRNYENEDFEYHFNVTINHNNFFEIAGDSYYFVTNIMNDSGQVVGLPGQDLINYNVLSNHFRHPNSLHSRVGDVGWPDFFGPNRMEPWNDVGP